MLKSVLSGPGSNDIVAVMIGTVIYGDFIEACLVVRADPKAVPVPMPRKIFQLMAAFDCGPRWQQFAQLPVMMRLGEDGHWIRQIDQAEETEK